MPTTNPVPSTDPSDLLFNAGKLDEVVNGTANSFTDRLGSTRRTVAGMNADFDAKLADAESDLNVYRADAAASAAEALGYLQAIRATSYGPYASDPATDPLGNPPTVGDEYFNTTANLLKRWNGVTWQASDINTANLAAPSGSSLLGYDGQTVQDVLDSAKPMQSYTAIRAYTGRATAIRITTPGIAGFFNRLAVGDPDYSAADDEGIIIVDGSGRRWKRQNVGFVNVQWFGAKGDGSTSDVPAVNAAIAYANSRAGYSVTVFFPDGSYNLKAGVTQKVTKGNVSILGENARILCEYGTVFEFNSGVSLNNSAVKGFSFNYPAVTTDVGATPIRMVLCLYAFLDKIRVSYAPSVFYFDRCSNFTIGEVEGLTANVARSAIYISSCSVMYFDDVYLINNCGLPPVDPAVPYPDPPVVGNCFIRINGGLNDTIYFKSGVLCNRYRRGLHATISLATESLINMWVDSCVFDLCYDKGVYLENNGGSMGNFHFDNIYIQASKGDGFHSSVRGGATNWVWITKPQIQFSGNHSIYIETNLAPANSNAFFISDPHIYGGNALGGGGIDIYCIKSNVNVTGGKVGINALPFTGYDMQGTYGILFSECDKYTVTGVESGGRSGSYGFTNNPASNYRARSVHDNKTAVGHSVSAKPEYETTALDTVVSGDIYTNVSPYKEYVSVYGSTASGAATIEVNGQQYSTRSEWSGILNPGDTLKVTTAIACLRRKSRLP